jgi:hypothetical protein
MVGQADAHGSLLPFLLLFALSLLCLLAPVRPIAAAFGRHVTTFVARIDIKKGS